MLNFLQKYTTLTLFFICWSFYVQGQLNWRGDTPAYPASNTSHTYTNVSGLSPSRTASVSTSLGTTAAYSSNYPFVPTTGSSRLSIGVNFTSNSITTSTVNTIINFCSSRL